MIIMKIMVENLSEYSLMIMNPPRKAEKVMITGVVQIDSRDFDGSILSVAIHEVNGKKHLVADNKMGERVSRYIGQSIQAQGKMLIDPDLIVFEVESFQII